MKLSEFKNITYDKEAESGIATITINRPEIKNALTLLVLLELYWAADAVEKDESVKAPMMTSSRMPSRWP